MDLSETYKRERKELQAKIQSLKHGIPKGDKKKKKMVAAEIAILEAELAAKHEKELAELLKSGDAESTTTETEVSNVPQPAENGISNEEIPEQRVKVSKAQKRRDKKANKEKERSVEIAKQEIENLSGSRLVESNKLNKILSERGLAVHEVPSDGDCLYKAVEHQLSTLNIRQTTVEELRRETADYMSSHVDDFIPFLTDPNSGEVMTRDQYDKYCSDVANTPAWGGHVEIQALSHICGKPIEVIQAEGPSVITGDGDSESKLMLSYHRHIYGLGEHYNSVVQKDVTSEDTGE